VLPEREAADPRLSTRRLLLRRWRADDLGPFAQLNADPCVMAHFAEVLDAEQSAELAERIERCFHEHGYGLLAAEARPQAQLGVDPASALPMIGFIGLAPVPDALPCAPAVELGWRLARPYWGRGLAYEGARAVIAFAFERASLEEVVAITFRGNARSRRLMERLQMRRDPAEDFAHPDLRGHPLAEHVLYRLSSEQWRARG
jgi:RimJ/RimL family protein N-acetyltransferase